MPSLASFKENFSLLLWFSVSSRSLLTSPSPLTSYWCVNVPLPVVPVCVCVCVCVYNSASSVVGNRNITVLAVGMPT